jgi:glucosamine--fructose-6-phosphate aminotransferase (isomerizing)
MCGIVGAVAHRDVVPILLEGLRRLEYRGYDSAGMSVINGKLQRLRSAGRVASLAALAAERGLKGTIGIGHTRWATHGAPCERNAHPHVSGSVSVVHNGIIENHEELRRRLLAKGYRFESDTDTEVIAHLVHSHLSTRGGLLEAMRLSMRELGGAYAVAVIAAADPARLVVARAGAPLLLGLGERENFVASDAAALLQVTRRMVHLDEGDCAEVTRYGVRIVDRGGRPVQRPARDSQLTVEAFDIGGYKHCMQKEIFEQPAAVRNTLQGLAGLRTTTPLLFGAEAADAFAELDAALLIACGTSYHAAMVGRHWLEALAGIPCTVEIASEYRYRESVPNPRALVIAISQSGETADTLAALQHARSLGHRRSLSICNVPESTLLHASRLRFLTRAGPEIGVASTKAFTTQLAALLLLAVTLAKLRGRLSRDSEAALLDALESLPEAISAALRVEPQIRDWAGRLAHHEHALFLGRGIHHPIAMEGALKLKEISYIHAEAYAAGELKHGPLALVDRNMPVIAIAPRDALFEKLKSNLQEVRARGGELYVLADQDAGLKESEEVRLIRLESRAGVHSPFLHAIPLQLLAYHCAALRGNDIDKPRNLAKSVTVE